MIYQFVAYYGAFLRDKVIYSAVISFNDCTKLLNDPIDSEPLKVHILKKITNDGFDPNNFTFDWLTKEQYENRIESTVDEVIDLSE